MELYNIKKYLNLKPKEKILKMMGNGEEIEIDVFSCLSYIHNYKLLEEDLFLEIEKNSYENKYREYSKRYSQDLDCSITNIPNVSLESIKTHLGIFDIEFKSFESLYILLNNDKSMNLLLDWMEFNETDKPFGSEFVVKLQEDIYYFTKRESVKRIKEQMNKFIPQLKNNIKKFEDYFKDKYQNQISNLKEIFNQIESPKEYAIMVCLLTESEIVKIGGRGRADFYRAWYDYIEKQYPIKDNFAAINDYIEPGKNGDFIFKIKDDGDYERMKKSFKEKFNLN